METDCFESGEDETMGSSSQDDILTSDNLQNVSGSVEDELTASRLKEKVRLFRCHKCKLRSFATIDELTVHLECHVDEIYRCGCCSYSEASWNRMLCHLVVHPEYQKRLAETNSVSNFFGKFLCPECGKCFQRKVNMQGHRTRVHHKNDRTCELCGLVLVGVDEKTFARHLEKCQNVELKCDDCDYVTKVRDNLLKHRRVHDSNKGFPCSVCNTLFPTKQRRRVSKNKNLFFSSLFLNVS